jgi:hypothetical protein
LAFTLGSSTGRAVHLRKSRINATKRLFSSNVQSASDGSENSVSLSSTFENKPSDTFRKPCFFKIFYNDVYQVHLPPRHRFPMKKYEQVRKQLQRWIAELPKVDQDMVHCGT